jgi:hypothetical protein
MCDLVWPSLRPYCKACLPLIGLQAAGAVPVAAFAPRDGVQIETDPKADKTKPAGAERGGALGASDTQLILRRKPRKAMRLS